MIDKADCLINDDVRRSINFELSNQYMLFLQNCDGFNVLKMEMMEYEQIFRKRLETIS